MNVQKKCQFARIAEAEGTNKPAEACRKNTGPQVPTYSVQNEVLSYLELRVVGGGRDYLYGTGRLSESLGEIV
jgi:hypothetical protein